MKTTIFSTQNNWTGTTTRITLGLVMLPHGAQKLLGSFGGYGFQGTMYFFTETMHLPWLLSFTVIIIEFFGSISLILGFATRIWAALFIPLMVGIIATTQFENGFFMNWFGNQKGEGYEFSLLMIGLAVATLINGGGTLAVDNLLAKKSK